MFLEHMSHPKMTLNIFSLFIVKYFLGILCPLHPFCICDQTCVQRPSSGPK